MKFADLKRETDSGKVYGVYLFEGEETFFSRKGVALLKSKFLSDENLNFASFDGENAEGVLESLSMLPFMSEKRITLATEFYPDAKTIRSFSGFFENPPSDALFLIVNEKPCDALKKFSGIAVIECDKAKPYEIAKWIKAEAAAADVKIDGAADLIAEYCLFDMTRIENETAKMIAFAGRGGVISEEAVKEMVYKDAEYEIFRMTDFIAKKAFTEAVTVVNDMLEKENAPNKLIFSIYKYFRRLLYARISDMGEEEMAKAFGVRVAAIGRIKDQAKKFSPRALKKAVDSLADADYEIKCGLRTADDKLWVSVFGIMTGE